jgi:hypothetical protein
MAKKDYKSGIAGLLQPTTPETKKPAPGPSSTAKPGKVETPAEPGETVGVYFDIPKSLKKRMDIYCVENEIKKNAFVIEAIEKKLQAHSPGIATR